jgi:hypothetical protein
MRSRLIEHIVHCLCLCLGPVQTLEDSLTENHELGWACKVLEHWAHARRFCTAIRHNDNKCTFPYVHPQCLWLHAEMCVARCKALSALWVTRAAYTGIPAVPRKHCPQPAPHCRPSQLHSRFSAAGAAAVDLLSRLLEFDPERRAGAEEAQVG